MKILAVGDIHTKTWIVDLVEKNIHKYDAVVFVGDYADDWGKTPQDTIETWKRLKALGDKDDNVHFVTGNHDYIYVNHTSTSQGGYSKFTQTLIDMPENRELREWLRNLPVTIKLDNITYSHAGVTSEWNGELDSESLWNDESPIWVRPIVPNYSSRRQYLPKQVFGHTPSETCWEVEPKVWCIDTFSTYPDGTPFGDETVLEVTNGKKFKVTKLEE
jgi:predicted MPP superfamily phosphohydrolase